MSGTFFGPPCCQKVADTFSDLLSGLSPPEMTEISPVSPPFEGCAPFETDLFLVHTENFDKIREIEMRLIRKSRDI